jgi:hypothetical protein
MLLGYPCLNSSTAPHTNPNPKIPNTPKATPFNTTQHRLCHGIEGHKPRPGHGQSIATVPNMFSTLPPRQACRCTPNQCSVTKLQQRHPRQTPNKRSMHPRLSSHRHILALPATPHNTAQQQTARGNALAATSALPSSAAAARDVVGG